MAAAAPAADPGGGLDPAARARALARLAAGTVDVLVVGGGVTGAGAALDAATRGLTVGLLEARDIASGTSSKSSKLIHGGLRYLEMLDFRLVREGLRERELLLTRLAPHLVRPVPLLFPFRRRGWERLYVGAGLLLYDGMGGARSVPRARHLTRRAALRMAPALRPDALVGAACFYDAQEDDARFALCVARTAAAHGAQVATRTRVVDLVREGGRVAGVRAVDAETGRALRLRARHVVGATGPWTDALHALAAAESPPRLRPSKGIHILVPRERIPMRTGLFLRTQRSVLFVIPFHRHWLIGDTDTDWRHDVDEVTAHGGDIDYLLGELNAVLAAPLSRDDVDGVFSGIRPLVGDGTGADTAKLSREHSVAHPAPGLTTVAGGKYTTYRIMARDVVDAALADAGTPAAPSRTASVPLLGAGGFHALVERRGALARDAGLAVEQVDRLLHRYGACARALLALVARRSELADPIPGGGDYLGAEVVYACTDEGALHLDDVLERRTRLALETHDRGHRAAEPVAALMAEALGWDDARREAEVARYRARVDGDLAAEAERADAAAVAARRRAAALP